MEISLFTWNVSYRVHPDLLQPRTWEKMTMKCRLKILWRQVKVSSTITTIRSALSYRSDLFLPLHSSSQHPGSPGHVPHGVGGGGQGQEEQGLSAGPIVS